ncbi:MAG: hypothetical protein V7749_05345 [Cocleimonas sp.]
MNINTKAIIASTLLTALFAGTSAIAGDNSYLFEDASYASTTESVVAQKVSLQVEAIEAETNR